MSTTDDTRERSVAEILGQPSTLNEDGVRIYAYPHPTVDDMLAWLRERVITDDDMRRIKVEATVDGWNVFVWPVVPCKCDHEAPTLHAALEAAVRAVAEASDE